MPTRDLAVVGAGPTAARPHPQAGQAILDACEHLRDRLLFALLLDTGVRIGAAPSARTISDEV